MDNKCPKCGQKLSPFYMKQNCPNCNVNLLYYNMDERLKADAENAAREVAKVNHFLNILKNSTIASPLLIIRLVLFFTPLASMCLTMYWAGSKNVSLISFIMSIINHGFDLGAIASDLSYLFAVLAMVMIILLSLAVIISSLFSATEHGFKRNMIFSIVNTVVYAVLSLLVCLNGGTLKAGFYVTFAIYIVEFVMHVLVVKEKTRGMKTSVIISVVLSVVVAVSGVVWPSSTVNAIAGVAVDDGISVVSFNVAAAFGTSIEDTDSLTRCDRFAEYMTAIDPDIIGTQELNSYWLEALESSLSDYDSYAVKRGGDDDEESSEMNGVFWKADKFTLIEENTFWLSETPDTESKYSYVDDEGETVEAGCNRICSYVVLEDIDGNVILYMNTHLDNTSEVIADFGVSVILEQMNILLETYPEAEVILTGDFNETSEGEAYQMVAEVLNDCTDESIQSATYQDWGYTSTGDMPIDFIFTSGEGYNYNVLDYTDEGYISDHYGIYSQISFE